MKLNLGCGNTKFPGFVNVDIRKEVFPDVLDDVKTLSTFEKNSADLIYACHVLEHFGRKEYLQVLKRWFDVLKPNGVLRLSVPDLEKVFELYNNKKYSLKELMGFLYGGQNYKENFHYVGFDFITLKEDLEFLGFKSVDLWDWKSVEHGFFDDFSQAYLPHMEKENGILMSLNIQAKK
jgi:ubiquinone/menaquinone biosynthesis C-methylase UbiE